ncbi:hypothetical protein [Pseudosulfitobacter sp. DSM 107133]|uniref:hypothetical protein n=1 Tax=Pseudosulfitobacter sp. DSM 107133 TaxID=2883100 RepID=UPI000DF26C6E|nr:hypothetical protein [Pseudosulfitobacter sp. DSM 107133]UOA29042.1 hypothetical protein DSM107133_03801 [Pseudosulfitobacter sp. DSM 107133]
MTEKTTAEIAEQVSLLMQIDRNHGQISSKVDMEALSNLPAHIASVFEEANTISGELTPTQAYALVNTRISQLQAQVYLMRLELENRNPRDPASIYEDPMVISAYGERVSGLGSRSKTFSFGPEILADGWYSMEMSDNICHRWMRPGATSLACVPHLGQGAQKLTINGYVMHEEQLDGLTISSAGKMAEIEVTERGTIARFEAVLDLSAQDVKSANYLPVEFHLESFRTPNEVDSRLLGANIQGFTLTSIVDAAA